MKIPIQNKCFSFKRLQNVVSGLQIALTLRAVLQWFYGREEARNFLYILHLHLLTNDISVVAFCTVNLIQTGETNYFADSVNGQLLFQDKVY